MTGVFDYWNEVDLYIAWYNYGRISRRNLNNEGVSVSYIISVISVLKWHWWLWNLQFGGSLFAFGQLEVEQLGMVGQSYGAANVYCIGFNLGLLCSSKCSVYKSTPQHQQKFSSMSKISFEGHHQILQVYTPWRSNIWLVEETYYILDLLHSPLGIRSGVINASSLLPLNDHSSIHFRWRARWLLLGHLGILVMELS